EWGSISLDNGDLLPAAPSIYHLPLTLLERLATGPSLAPQLAAARLYATLDAQSWTGENGILEAGGERWLIAGHAAAADIYRWDGSDWVVDGRVAQLSDDLNAGKQGGWFSSVPQQSGVAFQLVSNYRPTSRHVLTNAGGSWHEASLG